MRNCRISQCHILGIDIHSVGQCCQDKVLHICLYAVFPKGITIIHTQSIINRQTGRHILTNESCLIIEKPDAGTAFQKFWIGLLEFLLFFPYV